MGRARVWVFGLLKMEEGSDVGTIYYELKWGEGTLKRRVLDVPDHIPDA